MTETNYDVIIVGSGPGGSATASRIGAVGRKVLLLDKASFPRDKTCGDALSGKALRGLIDLGLVEKVESVQNSFIRGLVFSSPNGSSMEAIKPGGGKDIAGYCVKRYIFDNLIHEKAEKTENVTFISDFTVTDLIFDGDQVIGVKGKKEGGKEEEYHAKIVIGADGANSVVARKLGTGKTDPGHVAMAARAYYKGVTYNPGQQWDELIELHWVNEVLPGYFWIFPVGNDEWNIGIGMLAKDVKKNKVNLAKVMEQVVTENKMFTGRFKNAEKISPTKAWTLPLGSNPRKMAYNGVLLVGDAACLIDPLTGEGVGNALTSAQLATQVVEEAFEANDFSEKFLMRYHKLVIAELGAEFNRNFGLQKAFRRGFLVDYIIGKAAKSESLRSYVSHSLFESGKVNIRLGLKGWIRIILA